MDFSNRIIALVILLIGIRVSMVYSSCICHEPKLPVWEAPCGKNIGHENLDVSEPSIDPKNKRSLILRSLKKIKQNLRFSINFYNRHNYTKKNEEYVQKSFTIFSDNWLPTKEEVQKITINHVREIPKIVQIMYSMLQKYAMMFTAMCKDNYTTEKRDYAKEVMDHLKLLLCEVQSVLIPLQVKPIGTSETIPQKYLFTERTGTHLRDNEVIWKYGEVLREWRRWIKTARKQFRKKSRKKNKNSQN